MFFARWTLLSFYDAPLSDPSLRQTSVSPRSKVTLTPLIVPFIPCSVSYNAWTSSFTTKNSTDACESFKRCDQRKTSVANCIRNACKVRAEVSVDIDADSGGACERDEVWIWESVVYIGKAKRRPPGGAATLIREHTFQGLPRVCPHFELPQIDHEHPLRRLSQAAITANSTDDQRH